MGLTREVHEHVLQQHSFKLFYGYISLPSQGNGLLHVKKRVCFYKSKIFLLGQIFSILT